MAGYDATANITYATDLIHHGHIPSQTEGGDFYRSYASATVDGDLLKSSYILITAPAWAIGFGLALERLTRGKWPRIALVYGQHVGGGL